MKITIKPIWGILITSIVITGLVACSSSPSPWAQGDDSPWKSKRAEQAENVPADEFINEAPIEEPVAIADPEPAENEAWPYTPPAEPEVMEEPLVEATEEIAAIPAEPGNNEDWVRGLSETDYAVQLFAGRVMSNVTRYQETHGLEGETRIVSTDRGGDVINVLVHVDSELAGAKQYAAEIEEKTGSTPWIRSIGGLQSIVAQ